MIAFRYPPRAADRLLAAAGQLERLVHGLPRRLRSGDLLATARARLVAAPSGAVPRPALAQRAGAPVLYLPAVAWAYRFQRPQQLARALAAAGHPVLYLEAFLRSRLQPARQLRSAAPGVDLLRLRVPGRPDPYREVLCEEAAAALAETVLAGFPEVPTDRPLCVLVQLPFWDALGRRLAARLGVPLVYDRIDLHAGFPGVPPAVSEAERRLLAAADLVCATAGDLAQGAGGIDDTLAGVRRMVLLRNAVDLDAFGAAEPAHTAAAGATGAIGAAGAGGAASESAPRIGYVGALGPWFDAEALHMAAARHPGWRFRLAGEVEDRAVASLAVLANLELVGEIPFRDVPGFLADVDVALVPFRDLPLTRAVDPVKLYEALAVGLPVVARRLPETARWREPLVFLYDTPEQLAVQIERALAARTPELAAARRQAAAGESWQARAKELLRELADLAERDGPAATDRPRRSRSAAAGPGGPGARPG